MNRILTISLVILIAGLSSCDKENRTKKKLAGTWTIIEYNYSNYSGLTYEYEAEGSMTFENCEEDMCSYTLDMYYVNQNDTNYRYDQGYYDFEEGAENYVLYKTDSTGITDTLTNGRIILLTKKDLKLEFTDFYQRHLLIMEKD